MRIKQFSPFFAVFALASMLPTAALAASFPTLSPPPSAPVVVPTSDNMTMLRMVPIPSAYQRFSYNGYSFEIPRTWSSSIQGDLTKEVVFQKAGKEVARLTCPPPTTGYEAWDFKTSKRSLVKNGFMFDMGLNLGKPSGVAGNSTDSIAYLMMTQRGYQSSGQEVYWDPGYGCQLTSHSQDYAALSSAYRRIYNSVKVNDWKSGRGAGLSFRYPAAWTLEAMDSDSPYARKLFVDVNGREVAALDCPIPGQGFVEWDLSVFERKLAKQYGKYDIKWMFGSSTDEQNESMSYLQHLGWSKPEPTSEYLNHGEYSCRLISNKDGQKGIFREIYKSLK